MDFPETFTTSCLFSFNGQEKTDEISGEGNSIAFDERGYDPRLGRWWSVDPLFAKYPAQSQYSFVGNSPILNREIDGRDYGVYIVEIPVKLTPCFRL